MYEKKTRNFQKIICSILVNINNDDIRLKIIDVIMRDTKRKQYKMLDELFLQLCDDIATFPFIEALSQEVKEKTQQMIDNSTRCCLDDYMIP